MSPRHRYGVAVLLIPVLIGCQPPSVTAPSVKLDCETLGYPCSLSKVSLDVLQRGEALSAQVIAMLKGGSSLSDALAFIKGRPDVVNAAANRTALRFRLSGGRDVWIFTGAASPPAPANKSARLAKDVARSADSGNPLTQHVVGESVDVKRALVLNPFKWQFGAGDDGQPIGTILATTRGYEYNVTLIENAVQGDSNVGIAQFMHWDEYDVIHVSSHGSEVCDVSDCVGTILTGDTYSNAEELLQITEAGVNVAHFVEDESVYYAVSGDFFRQQYPGGLVRKIIFFSACQTFGSSNANDTSLGDALVGDGSVFLGWSEAVDLGVATAAGIGFYTRMSEDGVAAQEAHDKLGSLAVDDYKGSLGENVHAELLINHFVGRDLRVREVITLESSGGGELQDGDTVAGVGTANDGNVDLVPYQVLVEGIKEEQQDQVMVAVTVDGHSSTPSPVSAGERVGETGWRLSGQFPYIDLQPSQSVQMRAVVVLPEGGVSEQTLNITLTAEPKEPDPVENPAPQREIWTGHASSDLTTILGPTSHVILEADVVFEQTEFSVGKPTKRLSVKSGTLRWSRFGAQTTLDGDCNYTFGPIDVPILPGDGEILIDGSKTPSPYSMHGSSGGPAVKIAANCGDYAFTTTAKGSWAPPLSMDDGFVSLDGKSVSGSTQMGHQTWTWTFTRQ